MLTASVKKNSTTPFSYTSVRLSKNLAKGNLGQKWTFYPIIILSSTAFEREEIVKADIFILYTYFNGVLTINISRRHSFEVRDLVRATAFHVKYMSARKETFETLR